MKKKGKIQCIAGVGTFLVILLTVALHQPEMVKMPEQQRRKDASIEELLDTEANAELVKEKDIEVYSDSKISNKKENYIQTENDNASRQPMSETKQDEDDARPPEENGILQTEEENPKVSIAPREEAPVFGYQPMSAGWKVSKSVKGDMTSAQKSDMDAMIENWKSGKCTDEELKAELENYLIDHGITYTEVSVSSAGYTLVDEIPEVNLKNGGNLYTFIGIYSTGEANPDGTEKTVCYQWSAFVF